MTFGFQVTSKLNLLKLINETNKTEMKNKDKYNYFKAAIEENPDISSRLEELLLNFHDKLRDQSKVPYRFHDLVFALSRNPKLILRDSYQIFADMVAHYVKKEKQRPKLGFREYNTAELLIRHSDTPFFADYMFASRFMNIIKTMRKGIGNRRIYLFEGPPGSGKSTFINNLLSRLEDYTNLPKGLLLETVWHLDLSQLGHKNKIQESLYKFAEENEDEKLKAFLDSESFANILKNESHLDIVCPYHDHPILQIPLHFRKEFLDSIITDYKFKDRLFNDRQYEWVMKEKPCHICSSIYNNLYENLQNPEEILNMINAKALHYNRKYGKGITIFNPGDPIMPNTIENRTQQQKLNSVFNNENIRFIHSPLAYTNNGILALMDIKENNIGRLSNLHSTISDGIHRVDIFEERIRTLFIGVINPEDKIHFENIKSFQDRVINISIPYTLDYKTVVKIFKNKFGKRISERFLPNVLNNFARIIVSTRLKETTGMKTWIKDSGFYKFADKKLFLLKMEVYTGVLPDWLNDSDKNNFTPEIKIQILNDTAKEGYNGISGRQAMNIFSNFYNKNASKQGRRITMDNVIQFFTEEKPELKKMIPEGFIDALIRLYEYTVLQQVKDSIYYYNREQIANDIKNYLFSINYEIGQKIKSDYTGVEITVSEDYFKNFEAIFLGTVSSEAQRKTFRKNALRDYISKTLAQEISIENKAIDATEQFKYLFARYTANLKDNALAPYNGNDNFRRAIADYGTKNFYTYDERLRSDIKRLIINLKNKYSYSKRGAIQICTYVIDKGLTKKY